MSRHDLLPPNATQLERDLSRSTSSLVRAAGPVPIIRTAKRLNIPDSVVPWLIYEYGLGELLPYLEDERRALAEGILWQRIRGTPQALTIGLSWLNLDGWVEEPEAGTFRWSEFMVGLQQPSTGFDALRRLVGLSRISAPVRSRLQRVYSVHYDMRRFVLDDTLLSEGGMLSDHSGVRLFNSELGTGLTWGLFSWNDQPWTQAIESDLQDFPQVSFGALKAFQVAIETVVASVATAMRMEAATNQDRFLLSQGVLDEEWHVTNWPAAITTVGVGVQSVFDSDVFEDDVFESGTIVDGIVITHAVDHDRFILSRDALDEAWHLTNWEAQITTLQ